MSDTFPSGVVFGTLCGLISAVGYTATNIFLRSMTACDPVWVSCVKAVPTVIMTIPWLAVLMARRKPVMPTRRALLALVLTSAFAQLGGNVMFQVALGVVGLALTVPLTLGAMILTGAVLGRFVLHEVVSWRSVVSMAVLILAIVVLSLGAGKAYTNLDTPKIRQVGNGLAVVLGVCAAIFSGFSYALLGTAIRKCVSGNVLLPTTLFIVSAIGAAGLGAIALARIGISGALATRPEDWQMMILAGLCNAIAFLALTKSLQLTGVVYVNALNASQVAMAAIAGSVLFNEALTPPLMIGVFLTGIGLLLMRRRRFQRS